jgi:Delta3-Delta2-enoyl-CoA isomerase
MEYASFEVREKERVGILTMNFKKENRLNPGLVAEILETLDAVEADKGIGALVVTGADPKFFCNGLDLEWIMTHMSDPAAIVGYLKQVNGMFKRLTLYPKPLVAALNGHTFGAGMFTAAHMDFRVMREDRGWVCLPEIDINIPLLPGMIAICEAIMPPQGFRMMYYTGKRVTGPEALQMSFADIVCSGEELIPQSVAFAAELAKKKTKTYAEMKRRIRGEVARILDEVDPDYFIGTLKFSMP